MSIEAFPLSWPTGWPRTTGERKSARYSVEGDRARRGLLRELRLMGATDVIISSHVPLRRDGQPRSDAAKRFVVDPGVAVYFRRTAGGDQQVIACDRWAFPDQNVHAIGLAVAGLRAVSRSGASELLDRAFTGFRALPAAGGTTIGSQGAPWWQVLAVEAHAPTEVVRSAYRALASRHHPDRGGDSGAMAAINRAWEQVQAERGLGR